MTDHFSSLAITEDHSAYETSHSLINDSSVTPTVTTDSDSGKQENTALPLLSLHPTSTTSCLSDPSRISCISSSADFSTCVENTSINPTSTCSRTDAAAAAQNGSDKAEPYEKRMCASFANNDSEDQETVAVTHAFARTSLTDEADDERLYIRQRVSRTDNGGILEPHSGCCSISPHIPHNKSISSADNYHHPQHSSLSRYSQSKPNQTRWQQLVFQAGSAAGTTAAVVSEESMKCLRYCLHWLQYATQHIQQQMHLLRLFLVSLATSSSSSTQTIAQGNQQPSPSLHSIQNEIIMTLRKVVEVMSRYAGMGLPTHAKARVRSFILQLPGRWANLNNISTSNDKSGLEEGASGVPPHIKETSIKLLNFGGESIEMLGSISSVFSDSIDRAQIWLDRLRLVGVVPSTPATRTQP